MVIPQLFTQWTFQPFRSKDFSYFKPRFRGNNINPLHLLHRDGVNELEYFCFFFKNHIHPHNPNKSKIIQIIMGRVFSFKDNQSYPDY